MFEMCNNHSSCHKQQININSKQDQVILKQESQKFKYIFDSDKSEFFIWSI